MDGGENRSGHRLRLLVSLRPAIPTRLPSDGAGNREMVLHNRVINLNTADNQVEILVLYRERRRRKAELRIVGGGLGFAADVLERGDMRELKA
jgi:hypothetical protein